MTARVVVVGLGPAGPDLITTAALDAIERVPHRFIRTRRHPAAEVLPDATGFDDRYEAADSLTEVYTGIVEDLVAAAGEHGEVLYAVPGSPAVAEHTVELLRADDRVEVEVVPALSFLDLAWVRLGIDPVALGVRVVDGHRFVAEAAGERGPLLVSQCDRPSVLSDIKLAVDDLPDAPVVVLARLGLPDESITEVSWADLDRDVEPDHLTSLWIPELAAPVAGEVARFDELVAVLRTDCPWDREQTHRSLSRHLLEEAHEVLEVLDAFPPEAGAFGGVGPQGDELDDAYGGLEEELGDLLFQIVFHARLATEAGRFTLADVARGIHDKLVSRHPHVFGEVEAETADAVVGNWEAIKREEKGRSSAFDGIPASLPALARSAKILAKADRIGLGETAARLVTDRIATGGASVAAALLTAVELAHRHGVDPEEMLRGELQVVLGELREQEVQADERQRDS